jgi:RNA polymerase sigma factor (sigma-70 family)
VIEDVLRELTPQVLGAMVRRHGDLARCEDAVQEALLAAAQQWEAVPEHPRGWLLTVAERRWVDQVRSDSARERREQADLLARPPEPAPTQVDDTLTLLFLCCHPALTPASQLALTLRAVGGLTTAQIAEAFLVPETTIGQRISRAKARLQGERFTVPDDPARLAVVLQVVYLVFNAGYTELSRADLAAEGVRLGRLLRDRLPADGEVVGLLALMLLTEARRPARTTAAGDLVPLAEQDRGLWDRSLIAEGTALVEQALAVRPAGPYAVQAAIAAVHDEAPDAALTDWAQVVGLYDVLARLTPSPVVSLNRAVAVGMAAGPAAGLALVDGLAGPLKDHHRLDAVRGHLLERAGDLPAAATAYARAARRATSTQEQRFLAGRAAACLDGDRHDGATGRT